MKIFIPSKGRAGKITTLGFIEKYKKDIVIVVERQDYDSYRMLYVDYEFLIIEESDKGIGYAKRFIQAYAERMGEKYIFILDDDFIRFRENKVEISNIDNMLDCMIEELHTGRYGMVGIDGEAFNNFNLKTSILSGSLKEENVKIIQFVGLNLELLATKSVMYNRYLFLYEDVDFQLSTLTNGIRTLRLNSFSCCDYSYKARYRKTNPDKTSGAGSFWDRNSLAATCVDYLQLRYGDKIIKKRIDNKGVPNFTTYFSRIG